MDYETGKLLERIETKIELILRKVSPEIFTEDKPNANTGQPVQPNPKTAV